MATVAIEIWPNPNTTTIATGQSQPWTEVEQDSDTLGNLYHSNTGNGATLTSARCGTDTGTTDHYATCPVPTMSAGAGNLPLIFVACRYANAAATYYLFGVGKNSTFPNGYWMLETVIAGVENTIAGPTGYTWNTTDIIDLDCTGTQIVGKINGSAVTTVSNGTITTGTKGGIGGYRGTGDDARAGIWEVGTLVTATVTPTAVTGRHPSIKAPGGFTRLGTPAHMRGDRTLFVDGTLNTTNANDTSAATGGTGPSGALAKTNANDTSAASGASGAAGTLAKTNANDTSAAAGSSVTGSLAKTNQNDTLAATGGDGPTGSLARTNANDTLSASGGTGPTGSLARTNQNDTSAASGGTGAAGTLARTNANDTLSAAGNYIVTGTVAATNRDDTSSAVGTGGTTTPSGGSSKNFKDYTAENEAAQRRRMGDIASDRELAAILADDEEVLVLL